MIDPENTASPGWRVAGNDSPVSADWSTSRGSPSRRRASAGTMSPRRTRMTSPGTSSRAAGVIQVPSRLTRALIARFAFKASMALPAWRSSQNPTTALATSSTKMMKKSGPVPGRARQDHRDLDHPRDRPPQVGEELQERVGLRLGDLVGPVAGQPLLGLGLGETVRRRLQALLDFLQRKGLQVHVASHGHALRAGPRGTARRDGRQMSDRARRTVTSSFRRCNRGQHHTRPSRRLLSSLARLLVHLLVAATTSSGTPSTINPIAAISSAPRGRTPRSQRSSERAQASR